MLISTAPLYQRISPVHLEIAHILSETLISVGVFIVFCSTKSIKAQVNPQQNEKEEKDIFEFNFTFVKFIYTYMFYEHKWYQCYIYSSLVPIFVCKLSGVTHLIRLRGSIPHIYIPITLIYIPIYISKYIQTMYQIYMQLLSYTIEDTCLSSISMFYLRGNPSLVQISLKFQTCLRIHSPYGRFNGQSKNHSISSNSTAFFFLVLFSALFKVPQQSLGNYYPSILKCILLQTKKKQKNCKYFFRFI